MLNPKIITYFNFYINCFIYIASKKFMHNLISLILTIISLHKKVEYNLFSYTQKQLNPHTKSKINIR